MKVYENIQNVAAHGSLQWRHNQRDRVSNHQPNYCLLKRLFRHISKKTSKLCATGLWVGNSPVTGEFPTQRPVARKMFPFDDVIMLLCFAWLWWHFKFCGLIWSYNTFPSGMLRWCLFSSFGSTRVSEVALADIAESRHFLTIRYCKSWIIYIITWVSVCLHTLL